MKTITYTVVAALVLTLGGLIAAGRTQVAPADNTTVTTPNPYRADLASLTEIAATSPEQLSMCQLDQALGEQLLNVSIFQSGFTPQESATAAKVASDLQPHAVEFAKRLLAAHREPRGDYACIDGKTLANGLFVVDYIRQALRHTGQPEENIRLVLSADDERTMSVSGAKDFADLFHGAGFGDKGGYYGNRIAEAVKKYDLTRQQFPRLTDEEWEEIQRRM